MLYRGNQAFFFFTEAAEVNQTEEVRVTCSAKMLQFLPTPLFGSLPPDKQLKEKLLYST